MALKDELLSECLRHDEIADDPFPCTSHFHLLLVVFGFSVYCLFVYSVQA